MIKLRTRRLFRSNSKGVGSAGIGESKSRNELGQIEWEIRPGGMLVQKRVLSAASEADGIIRLRISVGSHWHHISIGAISTFGEMKKVISVVTGLQPREQRLLFRGREREDGDHLHMAGVKDGDKVLLLEDPSFKETKLSPQLRFSC